VVRKLLDIEPYSSVHEAACRGVLKGVFGDDDRSPAYYPLTPRHSLVAILQDRVIGLASVWDNANHPGALRSGVVVLPHERRQGVGKQLWEALLTTCSDEQSLVTSLWETQVAGYAFSVRRGFHEIRRTYTTTLPIYPVDMDSVYGMGEELAKQEYRILSYGEASASERAQMAALLQQAYVVAHAANPVRHFSIAEWSALAFSDDLLPWGSFAVMHGAACVAAALLHRGARPGEADLGWRGVADVHRNQSRPLMVMMAAHQIAAAAAHGITQLSLECDSTDPWSLEVLDGFPFRPAPTWITLRRD